jgi:hypothetical protein
VSFEISFANLWTHDPTTSDERASLTALSEDNCHVHGELRIAVDGRALPYLGFFGPDDVCFNAWVRELASALENLSESDDAVHVFDEGEQGQPSFHFEREGECVLVSVRASAFADHPGDPAWERVRCSFDDFGYAVSSFLSSFRAVLNEVVGRERGASWWATVLHESA